MIAVNVLLMLTIVAVWWIDAHLHAAAWLWAFFADSNLADATTNLTMVNVFLVKSGRR
jgi:hypothetical protein